MGNIRRWTGVVTACCAALVCGGEREEKGPKGKPLGPEWVKVKDEEFKKKVEGTATRRADEWKDSLTQYRFDLPHTSLRAVESDDGEFLRVRVEVKEERGVVQFELDRDEKGKAYCCTVASDLITYYDFDLDGVFDAYSDSRGKKKLGDAAKHFVLVDNAFVEVWYELAGFRYRPEDGPPRRLSLDRKTKYLFSDGKWKAEVN